MERILVSSCLLGRPVRYDGRAKESKAAVFTRWHAEGRLVPVCPEVAGGLAVPRPPAEITPISGRDERRTDGHAVLDGTARVLTTDGDDVTEPFIRGAEHALIVARRHRVRMAVLKEGSPSCAGHRLYDGSFSGRSVSGVGVTTALLERHRIRVFTEDDFDSAAACLIALEEEGLGEERVRP